MKKSLVFFFSVLISLSASAQSWPFAPKAQPNCSTMSAPPIPATTSCTKVAVQDGDWETAATWSPAGVPTNKDVVCIPFGRTVQINNSVYASIPSSACSPLNYDPATTPDLYIFLCGILDFKAGGKLNLGNLGYIQIFASGIIKAANGNSDLIKMACLTVWNGTADVTGPYHLTPTGNGVGILPVAFEYFRAEQKQPYSIKLDWSTLQEQNNTDFIIERSIDQKTWSAIGSVKSAGNSSSRSLYSFNDNNPATGNNSYRIRQVDVDGRTAFSEIVRVNNQVKKNISVFPNPVTGSTQVFSKTTFTPGQSIQLIDARGTRIKTILTTGGNSMQVDMSSLVKGLYLLQVVENGKVIESITAMKQ